MSVIVSLNFSPSSLYGSSIVSTVNVFDEPFAGIVTVIVFSLLYWVSPFCVVLFVYVIVISVASVTVTRFPFLSTNFIV